MKFSLSTVLSWILPLFYLQSHCQTQGQLGFFLLLSSRSFTVVCFPLRSVIHFELVFVEGVRFVSRSTVFFFFFFLHANIQLIGLSWWLSSKESSCSARVAGDMGLIPGSGRSPEGGHGNPLQHSCLENPVERGAWRAMVHRVAKSQTWLKQLACAHPVDQAPFVEKTVFAPLYCLCSLVKDQLTVFMWVHFWTLFCSIDLFVYSFVSTTLPWWL